MCLWDAVDVAPTFFQQFCFHLCQSPASFLRLETWKIYKVQAWSFLFALDTRISLYILCCVVGGKGQRTTSKINKWLKLVGCGNRSKVNQLHVPAAVPLIFCCAAFMSLSFTLSRETRLHSWQLCINKGHDLLHSYSYNLVLQQGRRKVSCIGTAKPGCGGGGSGFSPGKFLKVKLAHATTQNLIPAVQCWYPSWWLHQICWLTLQSLMRVCEKMFLEG